MGTKFGNPFGKVPKPNGKGHKSELLPSRHAMSELTKGTAQQRSYQNYAKLTPSGANAPTDYQSIIDMGNKGAKIL